MADLEIIAIHDIGEVRPGDDLAELIAAADDAHLQDGDCLSSPRRSCRRPRVASSISTRPIRFAQAVGRGGVGSHPAPPRRTHHLSDRTRLRLRQRRHRSVECRAGSGRPAAGRQRPISARDSDRLGPDTATTSPSSSATPLVARGVAVSPMSPSVAPVSGPSPTCEEPPTHSGASSWSPRSRLSTRSPPPRTS